MCFGVYVCAYVCVHTYVSVCEDSSPLSCRLTLCISPLNLYPGVLHVLVPLQLPNSSLFPSGVLAFSLVFFLTFNKAWWNEDRITRIIVETRWYHVLTPYHYNDLLGGHDFSSVACCLFFLLQIPLYIFFNDC